MPIYSPSQYQVDNLEQGDIIYIKKQKLWYKLYREFFLNLPKIKIKGELIDNVFNYKEYYQEDCVLIYNYELVCVQEYKNEVSVIFGKNNGTVQLYQEKLKSLQVGLYNVVLIMKNGHTLTLPIEYFEKAITKNKILLKQIEDRRIINDLLKYQRYKGAYFKDYVERNNIKNWVSAYCSVCGKPIEFIFESDDVKIKNNCNCGEIQIEKDRMTYDELSIWYYNQTNQNVKNRYNEFWFKGSKYE